MAYSKIIIIKRSKEGSVRENWRDPFLTCKYSLSVKFFRGHQADEDDKAASAGEYCGASCEDAVTVLLGKNGDEESIIKIKNTISKYFGCIQGIQDGIYTDCILYKGIAFIAYKWQIS